jgi:hypothetical protein
MDKELIRSILLSYISDIMDCDDVTDPDDIIDAVFEALKDNSYTIRELESPLLNDE